MFPLACTRVHSSICMYTVDLSGACYLHGLPVHVYCICEIIYYTGTGTVWPYSIHYIAILQYLLQYKQVHVYCTVGIQYNTLIAVAQVSSARVQLPGTYTLHCAIHVAYRYTCTGIVENG